MRFVTQYLFAPLRLSVALIALVALAGVPHVPVARAVSGDCTVSTTMDAVEKQFLVLINNYRVQNGLAPLALSYTLTRASAWKSADLGINKYFAHDDLTRTWVERVRDCGYGYNTWIGENIAAGYTTAQQVFDGWKNSPGHNANMLGANYTAIGIGRYYAAGSPYGWYWTTDFGGFDDGFSSVAGDAPPTAIDAAPASAPPGHVGRHHRHAGRRTSIATGAAVSRLLP